MQTHSAIAVCVCVCGGGACAYFSSKSARDFSEITCVCAAEVSKSKYVLVLRS